MAYIFKSYYEKFRYNLISKGSKTFKLFILDIMIGAVKPLLTNDDINILKTAY